MRTRTFTRNLLAAAVAITVAFTAAPAFAAEPPGPPAPSGLGVTVVTDPPAPIVSDPPAYIDHPTLDGREALPDGTPVGVRSLPTQILTGARTITSKVSGVRIEGSVTVGVGGTLENSVVVGDGKSANALVTILPGGLVQDVSIRPQDPSQHVSGVRMTGGTLRRTLISHIADGIGLIRGTAVVDHNWISDLVLLSPDPGRVNDTSHDDGIQIHGGTAHQITYNRIDAQFTTLFGEAGKPATRDSAGILTGGNPRYPRTQAMSAIMFNSITSFPDRLLVDHNWISGGAAAFNLGGLGSGSGAAGYTLGAITNNTFTPDQGNHANLAAIGNPSIPVTWAGNTYTDGTAAKITKS